MPEFIFMLTHHDRTVSNALDVYEDIRDMPLRFVGFKDVGVPHDTLRELTRRVHRDREDLRLLVLAEDGCDRGRGGRGGPAAGLVSSTLPDGGSRGVRGTTAVAATFRSVVTHTFASPLLGVQTARLDCNGLITAPARGAAKLCGRFSSGTTLSRLAPEVTSAVRPHS